MYVYHRILSRCIPYTVYPSLVSHLVSPPSPPTASPLTHLTHLTPLPRTSATQFLHARYIDQLTPPHLFLPPDYHLDTNCPPLPIRTYTPPSALNHSPPTDPTAEPACYHSTQSWTNYTHLFHYTPPPTNNPPDAAHFHSLPAPATPATPAPPAGPTIAVAEVAVKT